MQTSKLYISGTSKESVEESLHWFPYQAPALETYDTLQASDRGPSPHRIIEMPW